MITQRALDEAELLDLMRKLERKAPEEYAAVDAFFEADPDVEMKSPFLGLLKSSWVSHVRSVRMRKFKAQRFAETGQTAVKPKAKPAAKNQPHPNNVIVEFEKLFNHLNKGERYIDQHGEEKPYYNVVSEAILSLGWDYTTCRSTDQYTLEQEESFLNDMKVMPEHEMNDKQKTRLRITGRDCLSWLKKRPEPKQPHANGNSNGGI